MMKKSLRILVLIAAWSLGCGGTGKKAPTTRSGKQITVHVHLDRGVPGRSLLPGEIPDEATGTERNQLANWMENDLVTVLNEAGYRASFLRTPDEHVGGPGTCIVKIVLASYLPARRNAGVAAGLGEGASEIRVSYELFVGQGEKERRLLSNDRTRSSGRSWEHLAHQLNETIAEDVTERLGETMR